MMNFNFVPRSALFRPLANYCSIAIVVKANKTVDAPPPPRSSTAVLLSNLLYLIRRRRVHQRADGISYPTLPPGVSVGGARYLRHSARGQQDGSDQAPVVQRRTALALQSWQRRQSRLRCVSWWRLGQRNVSKDKGKYRYELKELPEA